VTFSRHAAERAFHLGTSAARVAAVLADPERIALCSDGTISAWNSWRDARQIRVVVDAVTDEVITVSYTNPIMLALRPA
jgi:hypothetical protein